MSTFARAAACTRRQSVARILIKKFRARILGGSQDSENTRPVALTVIVPADPLLPTPLLDLRQERYLRLLPLQLGQFGLFLP